MSLVVNALDGLSDVGVGFYGEMLFQSIGKRSTLCDKVYERELLRIEHTNRIPSGKRGRGYKPRS